MAGMDFYPFVLGAHGGFGHSAKALWDLLVKHAGKVQGRDWRHSWSAMSFSASQASHEQWLGISSVVASAIGLCWPA